MLLTAIKNLGWIATSIRVDGVFLPQNCTALWFLTCLFLSQLAFYLLVNCKPMWQCVLAVVFIAINYVTYYFEAPLLPWHLDVALIGSVFMLIGYYIKEKRLLDKVRTAMVPVLMIIISSVIIMWNDKIDMFFRQYGKDLLILLIQAVLMCCALMWICRSMHSFHLKIIHYDLVAAVSECGPVTSDRIFDRSAAVSAFYRAEFYVIRCHIDPRKHTTL